MSTESDLSLIYSNMLAGCVPLGSANPERVISLLAQDILDTSQIHNAYDVKDGYVYYLTLPSRQLASNPRFSTPLAAAFSGHPQHRGDGVYLLRDAPNGYALIRRGTSLRLLVNHLDVMAEAIEATDLPLYDAAAFNAWPLSSLPWLFRTTADRLSQWVSRLSLGTLGLATALFVVCELATGVLGARSSQSAQSIVEKANAAMRSANLSQPLSRQLTQIQNVSATVVRAGGWIEEYRIKGTEERFRIALPTWVSRDYLDSLGKGVTTDLQDMDNLIWVSKGIGKAKVNSVMSKAALVKQPAATEPSATTAAAPMLKTKQ